MQKKVHRSPAILIGLLLLALTMLAGGPCSAGAMSVGTWYQFGFTDAGTPATGCDPADPAGPFCLSSSGTPTEFADAPAWTITVGDGLVLEVVDAFDSGDRFAIYDNTGALGLTSAPGVASCGDDPAVCRSVAGMSRRVFLLNAGSHSFTITPVESPSSGGSAYFRVSSTPEPSSVLMMASGLLACAFVVRGKNRQ